MSRRKQTYYIKGRFTHRRTEADYMGALLDSVSIEDWRRVVDKALNMAKEGDAGSRAWLSHYLVGRPTGKAPAPLTIVVQQLAGRDPVVEKLAKPHIERLEYARSRQSYYPGHHQLRERHSQWSAIRHLN